MYNIFKFRAWSFKHKLMIYSDTESFEHSTFEWRVDDKGVYIESLEYNKVKADSRLYKSASMSDYDYVIPEQDVMISTGISDINKKLIYQGDIIKCAEPDFMGHGGGTGYSIAQWFYNAVVDYKNGGFYYYPNGNMRQPHQLLSSAVNIEVLGNIYENE